VTELPNNSRDSTSSCASAGVELKAICGAWAVPLTLIDAVIPSAVVLATISMTGLV
jgi:hypothetical protein